MTSARRRGCSPELASAAELVRKAVGAAFTASDALHSASSTLNLDGREVNKVNEAISKLGKAFEEIMPALTALENLGAPHGEAFRLSRPETGRRALIQATTQAKSAAGLCENVRESVTDGAIPEVEDATPWVRMSVIEALVTAVGFLRSAAATINLLIAVTTGGGGGDDGDAQRQLTYEESNGTEPTPRLRRAGTASGGDQGSGAASGQGVGPSDALMASLTETVEVVNVSTSPTPTARDDDEEEDYGLGY